MKNLRKKIIAERIRKLMDTHSYKTDTPEVLEAEDLKEGFTIFTVNPDAEEQGVV